MCVNTILQDHVTVVFDAKDVDNVTTEVNAVLDRMPGTQMLMMPVYVIESSRASRVRPYKYQVMRRTQYSSHGSRERQ